MELFLLSFILMAVVFLIMSIGVLFHQKPIAGSCGGLASLFGSGACDICESKDKCVDKLNKKTDC